MEKKLSQKYDFRFYLFSMRAVLYCGTAPTLLLSVGACSVSRMGIISCMYFSISEISEEQLDTFHSIGSLKLDC